MNRSRFRHRMAFVALSLITAGLPQLTATAAARPGGNVLFWSPEERRANLSRMEEFFPTRTVVHAPQAVPLPKAPRRIDLRVSLDGKRIDIDQYMRETNMAGLLVLQNGRILVEHYGLGLTRNGRWASFSVAKSFTSTLAGAAIADGFIKSVHDPVTAYIPGLRNTAFEGVTIEQLLTMSSGVRWNEDYKDPASDAAKLKSFEDNADFDIVNYMAALPRVAEPGAEFHYNTGNTHLLGIAIANAVGMPLSDYLTQKIWKPLGMERDAYWVTSHGQILGGSYLSVALRDFGRFGQFILDGGEVDGRPVLPENWVRDATRPLHRVRPGLSYGYQWWINDDGTFRAIGIFGQAIQIDPRRKLVVVFLSAWDDAVSPKLLERQQRLVDDITAAVR